MVDRAKRMANAGWAVTLAVALFTLLDIAPDLARAPCMGRVVAA
ncbi:hypothetical protein [Novosphingobium sp.]